MIFNQISILFQVGYDDSILTKLGSADAVESYWNAAAPHLQARYCHSSLGTKIRVERIGNFKHYAGKTITASGASLQAMFDDTVADLGDADLIAYMCHDTSSLYGTIGIAYRPVVCGHSSGNKYKESINEWRPTSVAFGGVNQLSKQYPMFLHNVLCFFTALGP